MPLLRYYLVLFFFTHFFTGSAVAEYNANYWTQVLSDINKQQYSTPLFLYHSEPNIANCDEGSLTEAAKLRVLEAVNEVRSLHELPAVAYSYYYDSQMQQAALVQKANNILTHFPPVTSDCYTQDAYDGSGTSNIHSSSFDNDPVENIIGWVNDSNNVSTISAVGHRRWMISPFLEYVSYGQTEGPAALKVFSFDQETSNTPIFDVDYVAFPYQKYPYIFFSDRLTNKRTPWSFTVIEDKNSYWGNQSNYFANAVVSVTNTDTGESLDISDIYTDSSGFGVPNIITWSAQNWEYDTWYSVEISNVKMQDGSVQNYAYDVFIDYADLIDITRPLENGDNINNTNINGQLHNADDEDTYEVRLFGDTSITGSSQEFSNMAFFINLYDSRKQLVHSADSAFTLYLEDDIYTIEISTCSPQNSCYPSAIHYSVNMTPPLPPVIENSVEDFVKRLYTHILGRTADTGGLEFWLSAMQDKSAAFVALEFFNSQEFVNFNLDNEAYVDILYQALFDRAADASGRAYWLSQLQNGMLKEMALYGFFQSKEFANLAERFSVTGFSQDDQTLYQRKQFVVRFYQKVLGREAEVEGYNFWVGQLSNGTLSAGDIARSFFFSNEFVNHDYDDGTFLDIAYQTILDRTPDQGGKDFWLGQVADGMTRLELINHFIVSAEFSRLADSYGVRVNYRFSDK